MTKRRNDEMSKRAADAEAEAEAEAAAEAEAEAEAGAEAHSSAGSLIFFNENVPMVRLLPPARISQVSFDSPVAAVTLITLESQRQHGSCLMG